jgi:hypothetical protein
VHDVVELLELTSTRILASAWQAIGHSDNAKFHSREAGSIQLPSRVLEVRMGLVSLPRNPMSEVSNQLRAAALARARSVQAARKAFISARSTTIRSVTPLYFFVVPVTVRLTAP